MKKNRMTGGVIIHRKSKIKGLITGVKPYSDVDKLIPGRFLARIYALFSFRCSFLVEIRQLAPK